MKRSRRSIRNFIVVGLMAMTLALGIGASVGVVDVNAQGKPMCGIDEDGLPRWCPR